VKRRKNGARKETAVGARTGSLIYGRRMDGTYIIEFKTAPAGKSLADFDPESETAVLKYFQSGCLMGYSAGCRCGAIK